MFRPVHASAKSLVPFALLLLSCARPAATSSSQPATAAPRVSAKFELVAELQLEALGGLEAVDIQAASKRAVAVDPARGKVAVIDVSSPAKPALLAIHDLGMAAGSTATSVAVHPTHPYYLTTVQSPAPGENGTLQIRHLDTGQLIAALTTGVSPDAVTVSRDGKHALVCNEGEPYYFDRTRRTFASGRGSLTLVELSATAERSREIQVPLTVTPELASSRKSPPDARLLAREVDYDGNGKIDTSVDFDGDGKIGTEAIEVGQFNGYPVKAKESSGETFLFPAHDPTPVDMEPEFAVFSPDGTKAFVTLQEANLIAALDVATHAVSRYFDLGVTQHVADTNHDGSFQETDSARAFFREPDGINVSPDGKLLVTCDEGDTDPSVDGTKPGTPYGGGRTVSVIDAQTGKVLGDTGKAIDEVAAAAGAYPDERSPNSGSEPEELELFTIRGQLMAAVSLERADAIAFLDLSDPSKPRVISVVPLHRDTERGRLQPEGLAFYEPVPGGPMFLYTANAEHGSTSVLRIDMK